MLWSATLLIPLLTAVGVLHRRLETPARQLLCTAAPLPALWLALVGAGDFTVDWLLLGSLFGLDPIRRIFLLLAGLLWLVAGFYAGAYLAHDIRQRSFYFLYLLTMTGNFGLILAEDIAAFYMFFALMTFGAYGLVVHDRTARARRAAFIYIAMAVAGEAFLLAAIFVAVSATGVTAMAEIRHALAGTREADLIMLCTFIGFGVKAGVLGIHMWLPLAHPVAPTPASAVLSGTMIKAGLLGWINLFPVGWTAAEGWSTALIVLGLAAAFYAVIVGLAQNEPKTNLAYSSISQMGLMTTGIGIGLAAPAEGLLILTVVAIYALSHGLAKGALFLGVGAAAAAAGQRYRRIFTLLGLFLAAAVIAGWPLTTGAIAKKGLKGIAQYAPGFTQPLLAWALPLSALGTALLLGRFLLLIWREMHQPHTKAYPAALWWSWVALVLLVAGAWFIVPHLTEVIELPTVALPDIWDAVWPTLLGAVLLMSALRLAPGVQLPYRIEPGDIIVWIERLSGQVVRYWQGSRFAGAENFELNLEPYVRMVVESERRQHVVDRMERELASWRIAGIVYIGLFFILFAVLVLS